MTPQPAQVYSVGPLAGLEAWPVAIPMKIAYRRLGERQAVLLRGPAGWGEFSPFLEYDDRTAARWLTAALESARIPPPSPKRQTIPVNVTVPPVDADRAHRMVKESGCLTAKVKVAEVGQDFTADLERVAAVREALGDNGFLRIDVNGVWGVEEAERRLRQLEEFDLQYVEQPCATLAELAQLRPRTTVPIAADESVRTGASPEAIRDCGGVDMVVLKVQPMGGVSRMLDWAARTGMPVIPSSALETSVGLATGLAAAAALPELSHACGLATASLLAADVVRHPLLPTGGEILLRRPSPALGLLDKWRPNRETVCSMIARLERVATLL
jgi:O-succinylbenzoate synthase